MRPLTLDLGGDSCPDLVTLSVEAIGRLGIAARAGPGYRFDPPISDDPVRSKQPARYAVAWAEVYLSCAGWVAFDPTNGRMGEARLVPLAAGRSIARLSPVGGR